MGIKKSSFSGMMFTVGMQAGKGLEDYRKTENQLVEIWQHVQ